MTQQISTNPRFADNGDIGPCDTSVTMMVELKGQERLELKAPATPVSAHQQRSCTPQGVSLDPQNSLRKRVDSPSQDDSKIRESAAGNPAPLSPVSAPSHSLADTSQSSPVPEPEDVLPPWTGAGLGDVDVPDEAQDSALSGSEVNLDIQNQEVPSPTTGTFSETVIFSSAPGPPSQEVDARASTAFSGIMGHINAISDECSSNGWAGSPKAHLSDGAVALSVEGEPLPSPQEDSLPPRVVCKTKTVNQPIYDIPGPETIDSQDSASHAAAQEVKSSFNPLGRSAQLPNKSTYPTVAPAKGSGAAKISLSNEPVPPRRGGWVLPPGGGLRGGAPLPGETSAISNGTTGWGPPPSTNTGSSSVGGWGSAPPATPGAVSAWGSPQQNNGGNTGDRIVPPTDGHYNLPSFPDDGQNNSKMLNNMPPSSSQPGSGHSQAPGPSHSQAPGMSQAPGPGAPQGSTSWAAAAGKGLPPSEPATSQANGTTNKQLEQLNSVREALFSQDGWGGQNVKQDTSWDVGATQPEPSSSSAQAPTKADSMQWQAPAGTGRNDGTDLWKSTLSGVPQPIKPQPTTPWGNHTPAHPADYKTWGEPEDNNPEPQQNPNNEGNMWNSGMREATAGASNGPNGSGTGPAGPSQPGAWDQDRQNVERGQFEERDRQNWGGPSKQKDEAMGWNNSSSSQWGGGSGDNRPRDGGNGAGWGPPPTNKPSQNSSWGQTPHGPQQPPRGPQWENDSPTMGRRFDDGTSIWGQKGQSSGLAGPPGGWKDMPIPNIGARGPPGPGSRMPPGPGMKPSEASPWGQPHPNRPWDDNGGWGLDEKNRDNGMGWGGENSWNNGNRKQQMPGGLRSSPSWDEPGGMMPDRGWGGSGGGGRPTVSKDMIWGSKQFRILCEMGFRKEDVETALRNTNLQLEDALEMLNALNRGMGSGRGMPPNDMFGPRGDSDYGMRFPGPMPYPPGDIPPANPSLPNNPSRPGNMNLMGQVMNGGPGMHGPPRPQPSGPPSTSQLRVLVQQIQMAVQAGHLNPQILNQPLAPQTLLLLNQLLQQIKQLQNCQQQHAMAQAAGQRPGAPSSQALLGLTVQITKHKQQIGNLQNQITAQQAQYLKNQQPQPLPGGPNPGANDDLGLNNLNIGEQQGGSKLLQIMRNENKNDSDFSRAPGSAKAPTSQSSPNLLLDNGPWSNGPSGNTGWPESTNDKPVNTSNSTEEDNFGIPEFVPGKAWKGTALKDPTEDPTLTPGSVAPTAIVPQHNSEKAGGVPATTLESSLGLTSSTWSFNTSSSKDSGTNNSAKDSWGSMGLPTSSSGTNLTPMGENLWGQSRSQSSKQQTPTTSLSGWPSSNGLSSTGSGWSNGTTTTSSTYLGSVGQSPSSAWLLLKNLTAQIDGSTLRTLCMQHGPLHNFHLYLTHGIALVKYGNGQEAKKAQNALNNCVLGNTTILATTTEEQEVENIVRTLSQHNGGNPPSNGAGRGSNPSTPFSGSSDYRLAKSSSAGDTWSALGSGVSLGWPSSGIGGSVWGAPDNDQHNRTTPLNSFLPPDLLSEGM